MERILDWLGERRHRATVVNLVMLSAILAVASSAALYRVVGGGALALAALFFLARALRRSVAGRRHTNTHEIVLTWVPGALAIVLALGGLELVTSNAPASLAYGLGAILFTAELAMLALAGADLSGDTPRVIV